MDFDSELHHEIEILKEIYLEELHVLEDACGRPEKLTIQLHPATGECSDQKWVCLNLQLTVPAEYPSSAPDIHISNPRGLSEDHVISLLQSLHALAEERKGNPVLYDIIEHAKETLTAENIPQGQCMVCLEELSFDNAFGFTRTTCYHYFHNHCLHRYIVHSRKELEQQARDNDNNRVSIATPDEPTNSLKQIVCPVCREPLPDDQLNDLECSASSSASVLEQPSEFHYVPSTETIQLQRNMLALFQRQLEKGGIIDAEAERNKYLVPKEGLLICLENTSSQDTSQASGKSSAAADVSSRNRGPKYESDFRNRKERPRYHPRSRTSYNEHRYGPRKTQAHQTGVRENPTPVVSTVSESVLAIDEISGLSDPHQRTKRESENSNRVVRKEQNRQPGESVAKPNRSKSPVIEHISDDEALSDKISRASTADYGEKTATEALQENFSSCVSGIGSVVHDGIKDAKESQGSDSREKHHLQIKARADKREQQHRVERRDNNQTRRANYYDGEAERYDSKRENNRPISRRTEVNFYVAKSNPKNGKAGCQRSVEKHDSCSTTVEEMGAGVQSSEGVKIGGNDLSVDTKSQSSDLQLGKTLADDHRPRDSQSERKTSTIEPEQCLATTGAGNRAKAESNHGAQRNDSVHQSANWRTDNRRGSRNSRHSYSENRRFKKEKQDTEKNSCTGESAKETGQETGQLRSEEIDGECKDVGKISTTCDGCHGTNKNITLVQCTKEIGREANRPKPRKVHEYRDFKEKSGSHESEQEIGQVAKPRKVHETHQGSKKSRYTHESKKEIRDETCRQRSENIIEKRRGSEDNSVSDGIREIQRESISAESGQSKSERTDNKPRNGRKKNHRGFASNSLGSSRGDTRYNDFSRKHLGGDNSLPKDTSQFQEQDANKKETPVLVLESNSAKEPSFDDARFSNSTDSHRREGLVSKCDNVSGDKHRKTHQQDRRPRNKNPRRTGDVKNSNPPSLPAGKLDVPGTSAIQPSCPSTKAVTDAVLSPVRHPPGFLICRAPSYTATIERMSSA